MVYLHRGIVQVILNIGVLQVLRPNHMAGTPAPTDDVRLDMDLPGSSDGYIHIAIVAFASSSRRARKVLSRIRRDVSCGRL